MDILHLKSWDVFSQQISFFPLTCICLCGYKYLQIHMCSCFWRPEFSFGSYLTGPPTFFVVFIGTESCADLMLTEESGLGNPLGSTCFHLPKVEIMSVCHHTWLFTWDLGIKFSSSCTRQALSYWASSLAQSLNHRISNRWQIPQSLGTKAQRWKEENSYHLKPYDLVK